MQRPQHAEIFHKQEIGEQLFREFEIKNKLK